MNPSLRHHHRSSRRNASRTRRWNSPACPDRKGRDGDPKQRKGYYGRVFVHGTPSPRWLLFGLVVSYTFRLIIHSHTGRVNAGGHSPLLNYRPCVFKWSAVCIFIKPRDARSGPPGSFAIPRAPVPVPLPAFDHLSGLRTLHPPLRLPFVLRVYPCTPLNASLCSCRTATVPLGGRQKRKIGSARTWRTRNRWAIRDWLFETRRQLRIIWELQMSRGRTSDGGRLVVFVGSLCVCCT